MTDDARVANPAVPQPKPFLWAFREKNGCVRRCELAFREQPTELSLGIRSNRRALTFAIRSLVCDEIPHVTLMLREEDFSDYAKTAIEETLDRIEGKPSGRRPVIGNADLDALTRRGFKNRTRCKESLLARLIADELRRQIEEVYESIRLDRKHLVAWDLQEERPYGPFFEIRVNHLDDNRILRRESFYFSIAHTAGAVACGVSKKRFGIDIEHLRPVTRIKGVTTFAFGERAGDGLAALSETMMPSSFMDLFLALWGAKECEIKANRPLGAPLIVESEPQERPRTNDYLARIDEAPDAFLLSFDAPESETMVLELYRSKDFRLTVLAPQLSEKPPAMLADRAGRTPASELAAVFLLAEPDDICRFADPRKP